MNDVCGMPLSCVTRAISQMSNFPHLAVSMSASSCLSVLSSRLFGQEEGFVICKNIEMFPKFCIGVATQNNSERKHLNNSKVIVVVTERDDVKCI